MKLLTCQPEAYYEQFKRSYDRNFSQKYGYLRSHIEKVIYQYLDCGILHNGFARLKCSGCGHEKLLAFSCKRRHFYLSCHAKRVHLFVPGAGEHEDNCVYRHYKIVKKILDYLGIYEFGKKRAPKINTSPDEFDDYIRDDYIDCNYVC